MQQPPRRWTGHLTVEQTDKSTPGRFESTFKISQQGKVAWDLNPNERYEYHYMAEDSTRSSTPNWTSTMETRKNIVRTGSYHRHGSHDCYEDHGPGRRPKNDSWFYWEKVTTTSSGVSSTKTRDECK